MKFQSTEDWPRLLKPMLKKHNMGMYINRANRVTNPGDQRGGGGEGKKTEGRRRGQGSGESGRAGRVNREMSARQGQKGTRSNRRGKSRQQSHRRPALLFTL